jgi:hypothetical protein
MKKLILILILLAASPLCADDIYFDKATGRILGGRNYIDVTWNGQGYDFGDCVANVDTNKIGIATWTNSVPPFASNTNQLKSLTIVNPLARAASVSKLENQIPSTQILSLIAAINSRLHLVGTNQLTTADLTNQIQKATGAVAGSLQ